MLKVIAAVRTVFLVFVIGSAVRAMPFWTSVARTFDEQYARCSNSLDLLIRAVWIAIGWIALETLAGWWIAVRRRPAPRLSDSDVRPPPA